MAATQKVAILGLDSVPPELLFGRLLDGLPNIKKIYEKGIHGSLTTCHPPITIPAWMVMMTGKNPGKLGIYGFRHRRGFSYKDGYIVNSTHVREKTVWDILAENGIRSVVFGVPPSYPPKVVDGSSIVSCFITPSIEKEFTYPQSLKKEILDITGGKYMFDVTFRIEDRDNLKKELFEMTEKRFDVAEYLAKNKPWQFFMMHEIGFDRLHHAYWKYFDPTHPKYTQGNKYEGIVDEYYGLVDQRIGRLLELFGEECLTFVLSDHGSKGMHGAFCVNQWLEKEGYLKFRTKPGSVTDLDKADIDWEKTKAWGWGGYYARIFFNVKGREPQGRVNPDELEKEKKKLTEKIMKMKDDEGRTMKNQVFEPDSLYGTAVGDKPDLMVYFDELNWRSAGTVGHDSIYLSENDTGPDDSVHSMQGVFLMYNPKKDLGGREITGARIEDMHPTLLRLYGVPYDETSVDGHVLDMVVNGAQ